MADKNEESNLTCVRFSSHAVHGEEKDSTVIEYNIKINIYSMWEKLLMTDIHNDILESFEKKSLL